MASWVPNGTPGGACPMRKASRFTPRLPRRPFRPIKCVIINDLWYKPRRAQWPPAGRSGNHYRNKDLEFGLAGIDNMPLTRGDLHVARLTTDPL